MMLSLFALWIGMSAQPTKMYESMCRLPRLEYGERYIVAKDVFNGECFVFERGFGEVYWQNKDGLAIVFPREK